MRLQTADTLNVGLVGQNIAVTFKQRPPLAEGRVHDMGQGVDVAGRATRLLQDNLYARQTKQVSMSWG